MEQEFRRPEYKPRKHDRTASTFSCALSAIGVALMTLCLLGAFVAALVWAVARLIGFPDSYLIWPMAIAAVPVLAVTIWTGGRAWHLERRLASGLDVDVPVFKTFHYLRNAK